MSHRVALVAGDGVGPEVIAEARRAVDALGLALEWTELPWGSAYWHEHGRMMPEDALETLSTFDAVLLGAIGDPSVPDHVSLWGLVLEVRQRLDLWANVRPARLFEGRFAPVTTQMVGRKSVALIISGRTARGGTRPGHIHSIGVLTTSSYMLTGLEASPSPHNPCAPKSPPQVEVKTNNVLSVSFFCASASVIAPT